MPAYNEAQGGEDYYSDAAPQAAPPEEAAEGQEPHQEEGEHTALLPKSILAGKDFKPGEEIVLKIVRLHDDQVEVAYASGEEKEPQGQAEAMPPQGDSEMASMMG